MDLLADTHTAALQRPPLRAQQPLHAQSWYLHANDTPPVMSRVSGI